MEAFTNGSTLTVMKRNGKVKRQRAGEGLVKHERCKNRFVKDWKGHHICKALLLHSVTEKMFLGLCGLSTKQKSNILKFSDNFDRCYDFPFRVPFSSTFFNLFLWHFEALVFNLNLWYEIVFKVKQVLLWKGNYFLPTPTFQLWKPLQKCKNANITKETTKVTMNTPWYILL